MLSTLVRRAVALFSLLLFSTLALASPALAIDGNNTADQHDWLNLSDPTNVVALIGLAIPVVVALITKSTATSGLKAILNLVLSALTATIAVLATNDGAYHWQEFLNAFLTVFVPSIVSYYGLWSPTRIADRVNTSTGNLGFGPGIRAQVPGPVPRSKTDDAGYMRNNAILNNLGIFLIVLAVILFVLVLVNVISINLVALIVIAVIGVALVIIF